LSPEGAQLRFAVEFATFLVAVAGAAIVLLRPHLVGANRRSRVVLAWASPAWPAPPSCTGRS
jgi:hypothetical protein